MAETYSWECIWRLIGMRTVCTGTLGIRLVGILSVGEWGVEEWSDER